MKFLSFSLFSIKLVVRNGQPHGLLQHPASKPAASVALAARLALNPFMTSALGGIRREHHRKNDSVPTLRPLWTNCLGPRRRGRTLSISPMQGPTGLMPRRYGTTAGVPLENTVSSAAAARRDRTHRRGNAFPSAQGDFRTSKLTRT